MSAMATTVDRGPISAAESEQQTLDQIETPARS